MHIEFKYFVAGHNPNETDTFSGMTTGDTILWAKIRDKWTQCSDKSIIRTLESVRDFLKDN